MTNPRRTSPTSAATIAQRERIVVRVYASQPAYAPTVNSAAVREIHEPQQAEDDREPERDERQDRSERNPVEELRFDQMNRQALLAAT